MFSVGLSILVISGGVVIVCLVKIGLFGVNGVMWLVRCNWYSCLCLIIVWVVLFKRLLWVVFVRLYICNFIGVSV